jgi:pimeloyl-ACP methyl ester carboxylesterase
VRSIELRGRRIGFELAGDGPPVVLVHGGVCDSRVWQRQLDSFSGEFTVLAWDAPGCGTSEDPPESFRLPDYADVLAGLMVAAGLPRAHVLGHSFGGALALELFRRHPTLVTGLTLVGGYAGWSGSLPADDVERRLAFALDAAERLPRDLGPTSMPGLFSRALPAAAAAMLATIMSDARPVAMRAMAHALAEADLRAMLPSVDVPTLLIHGDADERSTLAVAEGLHRAIPASRLVLLPGLGHECFLEDPEGFDAEVLAFLRETCAR